ncbi:MAG: hypothetical protein NZ853_03540 [Leptospiraceae bacterium]|nr:hypothetical protein [Leptospiraceae bacterium]MDW7975247.1 hypothetical protein [Leptospiraceae bacterium]
MLISLKHFIKGRGVRKFWFCGNFSLLIDKEFYAKLAIPPMFLSTTENQPIERSGIPSSLAYRMSILYKERYIVMKDSTGFG